MALYIRGGKVTKKPEVVEKPPKKSKTPYGIGFPNDLFFISAQDGDFDAFIEYLKDSGLSETTIDLRFYQLRQLKREACKNGFSVKEIKKHLSKKSPRTKDTLIATMRSYAKYRAGQGKWELLGVMLTDPEFRQTGRRKAI